MAPVVPTERMLGQPSDDPAVLAELAALDPAKRWALQQGVPWWSSQAAGIEARADPEHGRVDAVFYFAEGAFGYDQFAGALPRGLDFTWDRARVLAELGPPDGSSATHDGWEGDDYRLVVDYDARGRIVQICITTA